jgi:SAM-dependent methyltransferase
MKDYAANDRAENDDLNEWHHRTLAELDWRGKRVLDAGAGTGRFLSAARIAGANEVFAVDPNPRHGKYFQDHNIPYEIGYLSAETPFQPDILTCFEVIEHVYDPHPIFAAARALLAPTKGIFVVSTPNAFNAMRAAKFVLSQRHHDPLMDPVISRSGAEHIRGYSFGMVEDLFRLHGFKNPRTIPQRALKRYLSRGIIMIAESS